VQLIIGTYTERLPHVDGKADGVLSASFDEASGRISDLRTLAVMRNPSYLTVSASGANVYVVSETGWFEGVPGGGVVAFARDPDTGNLTRLNARPSKGDSPCHVTLDPAGHFVVVANYESGSVTVYPVESDGSLGEMADHVLHTGSGPNAERQASAHSHMTGIDPVTGDVLVSDLGSDTIFTYAPLDDTGRLVAKAPLKQAPGAGPRHLAFHPDGQHLFVSNELDSTVATLHRAGDGFERSGATAAVPVPAGENDENAPAAIRVSPSGRHVLVSNRGDDSISVFRPDARGGLSLAGTTPAEGECPRDFIFTPDGALVIVASQDSDVIASYAFDDDTGTLRLLRRASAATPVCLALV
jgi:6-phosphogluconolactonase